MFFFISTLTTFQPQWKDPSTIILRIHSIDTTAGQGSHVPKKDTILLVSK